jgi:hypothetical protein
MRRDIEQRLEKLERRIPQAPTEKEKTERQMEYFKVLAIAFYLGDPTPEGSIAEALMRALGYPNWYEFKKALEGKDPDLGERMNSAYKKLWAKFGVGVIREHKWDAIEDALRRMEEGLPDYYKDCLKRHR